MEITWLGHSCFRLKGKSATIVTDPYDSSIGLQLAKLTANVVTVSIALPDHNNVQAVAGDPMVIDGPGEYEVAGVLISGLASRSRDPDGRLNPVYVLEVDDLRVCHLGEMSKVPQADLVEAVGDLDVLMVPVGGKVTLEASKAAETISLLEPKIVIPMHYKASLFGPDLEPIDRFLREMGAKEPVPQPRVVVTKSSLPDTTQMIVMEVK